ncbi:hypothetical protein [Thermomonas sp.]|jgi:hypothetical protein|uniref:hypothetical protein n=1 Tax=Thermomonas sp. TaxID=1971895 RepID=UPI001ACC009F|nr:hypothetical protein [Xanthomonadales bacterium]MBN8794561.1 hypothetical protein [Stenotrophomonas nitritireducens]
MSMAPGRHLRFVEPGAPRAPADYWRTRSASERLQAVLALHREGNALFKGGNPPIAYEWRLRHDLPR